MKTVQEWLRGIDRETLIDEYLYLFPIDYEREECLDLTVRQIRARMQEGLSRLIDRLREMKIEPRADGDAGIFFAVKNLDDLDSGINLEMCYKNGLLESEITETYDADYINQAEAVGYLVADTPLTLDNIDTVLANILFEMAFFGFEQEDLVEAVSNIKQVEESIVYGSFDCGDLSFHTLPPDDDADDQSSEAQRRREMKKWRNTLLKVQTDYAMTSREIEEAKIREIIQRQDA